MLEKFSRFWWLFAVRGVFAILFSLLAFMWPGLTVEALVIFFGIYVFVEGAATIAMALKHRQSDSRWWVPLLEGFVSIVAGIVTFVWPSITAVLLLIFIAVWAFITGIFELVAAIRLREVIENEWALGLSGVASILFAAILLFNPGVGALALIWLIAVYALLFGVLMLYLAFKLRHIDQQKPTFSPV